MRENGSGMHVLFEERARQSPDAPALASGEVTLTYDELNRRANRLAHHLQRLGVGPEVLVAICRNRSIDMITAVLAVLKAGGAYVPLDSGYPVERLKMILEDTRAPILLTSTRELAPLAASLGETGARIICLDRDAGEFESAPDDNPSSAAGPGNLAYVIYTSGSTGRPKGVLVENRGLQNVAEGQAKTFELRSDDRVLQFSSLCFDASVFEFLMTWQAGACLCLGGSDVVLAGPALAAVLREQAVTTLTIPPSILAGLPEGAYPDLRTLIVAGEACPPDVLRRWAPGRRVFNAYGPTEITIWASGARCEADMGRPPIGRAIAGTAMYLLDQDGRPVPEGQPGEVYVGGTGVTRGYLHRPELTADRFLPDPFDGREGARMYRTGDLGRVLDDGNIDFLGRVDHQVKIRGYRVELGEIEASLWRHPSVDMAVVDVRQDGGGPRRLVAYVVPARGATPSVPELRGFLKESLPDYMVPAAFVTMEAFPLLPNGKVDRRALPAPEAVRPDLDEPYLAPRTALEELLAGIWAEVLKLDRVGVNDDLFALGGDSLMATQIVARVREVKAELPLQAIFAAPTVAGLASAVEGLGPAGVREAFPPLKRRPPDAAPAPLSYSQERVWFLQQLQPSNLSYSAQATVTLSGAINIPVLEAALTEIVRRHEILRTTFPVMGDFPIQVVHEPWAVKLEVTDISGLPAGDRERRLSELVSEVIRKPFDLDRMPLVCWSLVRTAGDEHVFIHCEHHLLHDGWSFAVLLREIKALYEAFLEGRPSPLPELEVQFSDYAAWQRGWADTDVVAPQLEYWKKQLAGSPPVLELPSDRPRPLVQSFEGAALRLNLPETLARSLNNLARKEGATLYMTLLTVFVGLLHRYTRQEDFCLGAGLANRRWKGLEQVIGMVINTVALRFQPVAGLTFRELLARVRRVTLEAYENQDVPFDRVVDVVRPERSLGHLPIYQVVFAFHDSAMPELELGEASMKITEAVNNGSAKFDLSVVGIPRFERQSAVSRAAGINGVTLIWEYTTDLFTEETISRMAAHYVRLLEAVVADPARPFDAVDLVTESERDLLINTWNAAAESPYTDDAPVPQLIEEQAARAPEAEAVGFQGRSLTYGELSRASDRLAERLRTLGVGPETIVAVLAERSLELVPALLGVLKAGGAYVPIDPAYPGDRIRFMLEDTGATVVLTQGRLLDRLPKTTAHVVDLDQAQELEDEKTFAPPASASVRALGSASAPAERDPCRPMNVAYIIYTSGSTGRPKGVMVSHRSLLNLVFWYRGAFKIGPEDRVSQVASLGFDASVFEIWPALTAGASVQLVDSEDTRMSAEAMRDWILRTRTTVSFLPTPLAEMVLKMDWPSGSSLRLLLTGGDRLRRRPSSTLPFSLVNNYGPTENAVVSTFALVPPADPRGERGEGEGAAPTIGRPVSNNQVYILDPALRLVPVGVPGELCVAGDSLARGYLARPDLTAEVFVPNPFAKQPGSRMYRTGDRARFLPDGSVDFLGRLDHQVKIRGFRVELGEIEATLLAHPSIRQAAVTLRQDAGGTGRLVAYASAAKGERVAADEIKAFLRTTLPEYMVPSVFILMEELPTDGSGKVDRRALPDPALGDLPDEARVAPRTPLEEELASVWCEVLGLETVGVTDNFFASGGHSLSATQVISRVRQRLGVELPLRSVFSAPTIAELAETIEDLLLEQVGEGELESLLDELENLPEDAREA